MKLVLALIVTFGVGHLSWWMVEALDLDRASTLTVGVLLGGVACAIGMVSAEWEERP